MLGNVVKLPRIKNEKGIIKIQIQIYLNFSEMLHQKYKGRGIDTRILIKRNINDIIHRKEKRVELNIWDPL